MTVDVLRNPLRSGAVATGSRDPRVRAFHRSFEDYRPSPVHELAGTARRSGVGRLLVKDEGDRLGLPAFKMLGASWASYRALVERLGQEPAAWSAIGELAERLTPLAGTDLATATDGNHGRAVASFARRVGLGARIFVPTGTSAARIAAIEDEGASCTVVDGTYEDAVERAADEAGPACLVVSDTSWPGYEEVPNWVIDGYATIFAELDEQLDALGIGTPDVVVVPMGVGALAAATARWYRSDTGSGPGLIGVEPETANCVLESARAGHPVEVPGPHRSIMAGLNCGRPSPVAWPSVSGGFDWFCAIDDASAVDAMRELACEGIVSGETGAAALAALMQLAGPENEVGGPAMGLTADATVVVLSTEGATDPDAYAALVGYEPARIAVKAPACAVWTADRPGPADACPVDGCPSPCRTTGTATTTGGTIAGDRHRFRLAGRSVEVPIVEVAPEVGIALFITFDNGVELVDRASTALAERLAHLDADLVATNATCGIPVAIAASRALGLDDYLVLQKTPKIHLADALTEPLRSITTGDPQHLRLDRARRHLVAGRRVVVVDDVISTGTSIAAATRLVRSAGGDVVGIGTLLAEGRAWRDALGPDAALVEFLAAMPVFRRGSGGWEEADP